MKVYCYHEPLLDNSDVIDQWFHSWARNGWEPIVLSKESFDQHPMAPDFEDAVSRLPTVNDRAFEMACFRRWLAMAMQGGGVLTDYDILNRRFRPEHAPQRDGIVVMGAPMPVFGNGPAYETVAKLFALYRPDERDACYGKPHVSDMTILARASLGACINRVPVGVVHYGQRAWDIAPLVHYSNDSTVNQHKPTVIKETFR